MTDPTFTRTMQALDGPHARYAASTIPLARGMDLSVGEVRYPMPPPVQDCIDAAVRDLDRIWYGDPAGQVDLRIAYLHHLVGGSASWLADPEQVLITAGGKEAAWLAVRRLLADGRIGAVVVPRPGWQPYTLWACAADVRTVGYDPVAVAQDPAALTDALRDAVRGGDVPVVVVNYPHNPTGVAVTQPVMDRIVAMAGEYGAALVSDEVYRTFADAPVTAARAAAFDPTRHVVVDSASKWLASAGLRVGFVYAAPTVVGQLRRFRDTYASCTSSLTQTVAHALMTDPTADSWLTDVRATIDSDRAGVVKALAEYGVTPASHGGLYLWLARPAEGALLPAPGSVPAVLTDGDTFDAPDMIRACVARADLDTAQAAAGIVATLAGA